MDETKIENRAMREINFLRFFVEGMQEFNLTRDELTRCIGWICAVYEIPMDQL